MDRATAGCGHGLFFVCSGTNDQETIQKAIDLCAKDGRNLYLYNGLYMIDAFREWNDGGPRAAVRIPKMLRHFTIEGQEFFDTDLGKLLICIDPHARTWVDAMGSKAE